MRAKIIAILAILIAPALALGQALADRVPADAQIYIGWKGAGDLGAGYEASHLKAVMNVSQLSELFTESIPRLVDRLSQGDPNAAAQAHTVMEIAISALRHPTAIYFGGLETVAGGSPAPKFAVLCDAGEDAPALNQKITQLLSQAGPAAPIHVQSFGSLVVLSSFEYTDHPADALGQNKQFQDAMAQQVSDPVVAMYVDTPAVLQTASALIQQFAPPQAQQMWPQIRQALGLDSLKYVAGTDGFDGKNWASRVFISAPGVRQGLLASGASAPLGQDLLGLIPQSVTMAGACSFDLNALFTQADSALQQINPDAANQFHQGLQQINQMVGFDIQKDLLAALGPQWAYYVDPATAGTGALGITIINQPRNPDGLQTSLTSLENFANVAARQQFANPAVRISLEFRQFTSNGVTVHYLAAPLLSPAWAIKDGRMYAGLYPQIVVSAVNRQPDGKSITDNPGFQMVMKELNAPSQYDSFQYVDLPQTIPQGYQAWLLVSRLYLGYGDIFGLQSPPLVLPPLDKLTAEAEPGGTVSWSDDKGFYVRSITPFPGADALGAAW